MSQHDEQAQVGWLGLATIWFGGMISVPSLLIGSTLIAGLPFWDVLIAGAIGFYLGIDTPPLPFQAPSDESPRGKIDAAELQSAIGTFLAALAAFLSVGLIVLRADAHFSLTATIMGCWVVGVVMQIIAGAIARTR